MHFFTLQSFNWKELAYFAAIAVGILLPELYLHVTWNVKTLIVVRMVTLFLSCIVGVIAYEWATPGGDPAVVFTRVFIYIGICRVIMLSSHDIARKRGPDNAQHPDTPADGR